MRVTMPDAILPCYKEQAEDIEQPLFRWPVDRQATGLETWGFTIRTPIYQHVRAYIYLHPMRATNWLSTRGLPLPPLYAVLQQGIWTCVQNTPGLMIKFLNIDMVYSNMWNYRKHSTVSVYICVYFKIKIKPPHNIKEPTIIIMTSQ